MASFQSMRTILENADFLARLRAVREQYPDGVPAPEEYRGCPVCQGAGWVLKRRLDAVAHITEGELEVCGCQAAQHEETLIRRAVGDAGMVGLETYTFESMIPLPGQESQWAMARDWVNRPIPPLLWFYSNVEPGYWQGKTTLAMCLANWWIGAGMTVLYREVPMLLNELRETYSPKSDTAFAERLAGILHVPALVLDDLGKQKDSKWVLEQLFTILNHRYDRQLPTVVTTNLSLEEMAEHEEEVYRRIFYRISEPRRCLLVPWHNPPLKLPGTKEDMDER